jgi:predicted ATPase
VDRSKDSRVLLVVTFRPRYTPPWGNPGHLTRLTMPRLGRRQCAALVEAVTEGKRLPSELVDEIVAKTDGIPLFVEELTKMVLASGQLDEADGVYRLKGPLPALAIPSSLQDVLTARLDWSAEAKEVAQVGSAIGREFSHKLLLAVLAVKGPQLSQALDELLRAELVTCQGIPPDAIYSFRHALIRDAAYDSILKSRRKACHARISEVIERDEPNTVAPRPELLAHHNQEGGRHSAALRFWSLAGDLATSRSASREAAAHYRSALALLPRLANAPERSQLELDLNMKLANALMQLEGYSSPDSHSAYARARTVASELGQTGKYISACIEMAPTLFAQTRGSSR